MSEHTPGLIEIYDEATDRSVRARPAFIVKACNSHNALLDALREIKQYTAPLMQAKDPLGFDIDRIASAAIAEAEGGDTMRGSA